MHRFLSCPKCQARLRAAADTNQSQVSCGACGHVFAAEGPSDDVLDAVLIEDEPKEAFDVPSADDEPSRLVRPLKEYSPSADAPGYLFPVLALTPLGIAALGALFCRFGTGWIGVLVWGAFGGGLALACVGLVRQTQWSWVIRLLGALGLTGGGYLLLFAALGVSLWQMMRPIVATDWRDFSPPDGRFHVSVPGTPERQTPPEKGLPPGSQTYVLEKRWQDVTFGISYGEMPLEELLEPEQLRFMRLLEPWWSNLSDSILGDGNAMLQNGNPVREYHFRHPGKGMTVVRFYFVGNRLYVLHISGARIVQTAPRRGASSIRSSPNPTTNRREYRHLPRRTCFRGPEGSPGVRREKVP
ncbi:MAG TPA: hypothetical protein VH682_04305 [Gemmataceae bacterium]|jgi:hypothetical protein